MRTCFTRWRLVRGVAGR